MELFLVRHGEAKSGFEDPACPLTERGMEEVRRMAAWAAQAGVKVDQIRHSGKMRAEQTAALLAEQLNPARGTVAVEGLRPNDHPAPIAEALSDEDGSLMLVAHQPFLGNLACHLLAGETSGKIIRFQNGEIVSLSPAGGKWSVNWVMSPDLL